MNTRDYGHPEPVPSATQLALLPFLAAVDGLLREGGDVAKLRTTIHRVMSREGEGYLQQACGYIRGDSFEWRGIVGRIFPVTEGIIGAACESGTIWRTREFSDVKSLLSALRKDMRKVGDDRKPEEVAMSYLAIPFLGTENQAVLILYADCNELNFFADDERLHRVVAMCNGLCRLFDSLQNDPFPNLQNFPLQRGEPVTGKKTVYEVQEELSSIDSPKFIGLPSFNYEVSVS